MTTKRVVRVPMLNSSQTMISSSFFSTLTSASFVVWSILHKGWPVRTRRPTPNSPLGVMLPLLFIWARRKQLSHEQVWPGSHSPGRVRWEQDSVLAQRPMPLPLRNRPWTGRRLGTGAAQRFLMYGTLPDELSHTYSRRPDPSAG